MPRIVWPGAVCFAIFLYKAYSFRSRAGVPSHPEAEQPARAVQLVTGAASPDRCKAAIGTSVSLKESGKAPCINRGKALPVHLAAAGGDPQ